MSSSRVTSTAWYSTAAPLRRKSSRLLRISRAASTACTRRSMSAGFGGAWPARTSAMKRRRRPPASSPACSGGSCAGLAVRPVSTSVLPGCASSRSASAVMPRAPPVASTTMPRNSCDRASSTSAGASTVRKIVRRPPGYPTSCRPPASCSSANSASAIAARVSRGSTSTTFTRSVGRSS